LTLLCYNMDGGGGAHILTLYYSKVLKLKNLFIKGLTNRRVYVILILSKGKALDRKGKRKMLYVMLLMNGTLYTFKTEKERFAAWMKLPDYKAKNARFYEMVL